jgi:hypothetical protein
VLGNSSASGPCSASAPKPQSQLKGDWNFCSKSKERANRCCSRRHSNDGKLKRTPVRGHKGDICVPWEGCWSSGTIRGSGTTCGSCCSGKPDCPWHQAGIRTCKQVVEGATQ